MGPGAITHAEVMAWLTLTGHIVYAWEVRALLMLDDAQRAHIARASQSTLPPGPPHG